MMKKELLLTFTNENTRPSIWLMRQAGRYLPEYRKLRGQAKNFMDFCLNPSLAAEATLQPIRRFGFDGAILFSDILVIPYAFGQEVTFVEGIGPKLSSLENIEKPLSFLKERFKEKLSPIFDTVKLVTSQLPAETTLIGFSGCPWTLACYMIDQGSSKDFFNTRLIAYQKPQIFKELIKTLSEAIIWYLSEQIRAGVEVVQLFDSWIGLLSVEAMKEWGINPTSYIIKEIKKEFPKTPIIIFPKGGYWNYLPHMEQLKADAISIDSSVPLTSLQTSTKRSYVIQGNLDPFTLLGDSKNLRNEVQNITQTMGKEKFIFNLGHGILPQTPLENVYQLVDLVKRGKK